MAAKLRYILRFKIPKEFPGYVIRLGTARGYTELVDPFYELERFDEIIIDSVKVKQTTGAVLFVAKHYPRCADTNSFRREAGAILCFSRPSEDECVAVLRACRGIHYWDISRTFSRCGVVCGQKGRRQLLRLLGDGTLAANTSELIIEMLRVCEDDVAAVQAVIASAGTFLDHVEVEVLLRRLLHRGFDVHSSVHIEHIVRAAPCIGAGIVCNISLDQYPSALTRHNKMIHHIQSRYGLSIARELHNTPLREFLPGSAAREYVERARRHCDVMAGWKMCIDGSRADAPGSFTDVAPAARVVSGMSRAAFAEVLQLVR
jgi:hypothetical protein